RMACPTVTSKKLPKRINQKERRLALKSAIAATASDQVVRSRGHKFLEDRTLPLVVSNEVENLSKSSDAKRFLTSIGVWDDILRVRKSKRIKSGVRVIAVGTLIVVGNERMTWDTMLDLEAIE